MIRKLLLLTTLLSASLANAQVPNGGFETLTPDDHVSQWVKNYMISITVDSTGEFHGDSIVFDNPDNQLYRSTTDAHTGQYALEMTNGFNYTTNSGFVGGAFLASSEFYSALTPEMVYVDPIQPETFEFYFKYFPIGNDSAQAVLTLYDMDGIQIGEARKNLGGTTSAYTLVSLPIQYSQVVPVSAISISFLTAVPGYQPTPGTVFIVDDVALNGNLSVSMELADNIALYPNPVNDLISIKGDLNAEIGVTDLNGASVQFELSADGKINCSAWQNGCYFIHFANEQAVFTKRIIVSH